MRHSGVMVFTTVSEEIGRRRGQLDSFHDPRDRKCQLRRTDSYHSSARPVSTGVARQLNAVVQ